MRYQIWKEPNQFQVQRMMFNVYDGDRRVEGTAAGYLAGFECEMNARDYIKLRCVPQCTLIAEFEV